MNEFEANTVIDILEILNGEDISTCIKILDKAKHFLIEYSLDGKKVFDCRYFTLKKTIKGMIGGW